MVFIAAFIGACLDFILAFIPTFVLVFLIHSAAVRNVTTEQRVAVASRVAAVLGLLVVASNFARLMSKL